MSQVPRFISLRQRPRVYPWLKAERRFFNNKRPNLQLRLIPPTVRLITRRSFTRSRVINKVPQVYLWGSILFLLFLFVIPLFSYAQAISPEPPSQFFYELGPGEVADGALVIPNESALPKSVSVYVGEVVGTHESSFVYSKESDVPLHIGSWVRFYPKDPPAPQEEVIDALVRKTSARISQLCQALEFGKLVKKDREQKVVYALNRFLRSAEIQYLAELSEWCRGEVRGQVSVSSFENKQLPFVMRVPEGVREGEYRGGFFVADQSNGAVPSLAASIVETLPGVRAGALTIQHFENTYDFRKNRYRFEVVVTNDGGSAARGKVAVKIWRQFPRSKHIVLSQATALLPGEERRLYYEWIPFFGTFEVRAEAQMSAPFFGEHKSNLITFFFLPRLFVLFIFSVFGLVSVMVWLKRYWRRRWLSTITQSWRCIACQRAVSLMRIAQENHVESSLIALANGVPIHYRFQSGDEVLLPQLKVRVGVTDKRQRTKPKRFIAPNKGKMKKKSV